ncbi:hepcidin [Sphaerodactylus townsendi]|uniref:hepcidin n=1 Tax=Sphaerodactylus townsendi TaxID=933632 RepID=UPI002026F0B6|nr:hepcidin [Sphaerodactylus townsendi]
MKLQFICLIFLLLSMTTRSLCAFTIQTQVKKDLASSEMHHIENGMTETSGMQALLRRSKRFNSHFPICTYCCNCCSNKKCGFCCRT